MTPTREPGLGVSPSAVTEKTLLPRNVLSRLFEARHAPARWAGQQNDRAERERSSMLLPLIHFDLQTRNR